MARGLSRSRRLTLAFAGFLILAGILFTSVFALAISGISGTEMLNCMQRVLPMVLLAIGVLDIIAGVLLKQG